MERTGRLGKQENDRGKEVHSMRVKLLRGDDEATVLLVHPATLEEYARALDTLGRAERRPANGCGVVTTAEQRARWELPDLAASGRARVVDSAQAFALLAGPAEPETAWEPSAGPAAGAAPPPRGGGGSGGPALAAVRALAAPGTQVDQALATLDDAGLPAAVRQTLRRQVREALDSRSDAVREALGRAEKALALPWRTSESQGFDPQRLQRALNHSHGALAQVKTRIRDVLAACPQTRALLTVERPGRGPTAAAGAPPALAVRPGPPEAPGSVLCLAGPKGTGKSSLAEAVARALGRTHVRATLEGPDAERLVRGSAGGAAGRIVEGLCEAGVNNPVFILEAVDRVEPDAAGALLYLLDPARRTAFRDAYLDVAFDLSAVLWIVTATDPGAVPEPVREHLAVVELPACTDEEKLAIAQQHLLTRPFDAPAPAAEAWLPPGSLAPPALIEPAAAPNGPAVVAEREVASARELEEIAAQPPPPDVVEAWRTAACDGEVRFETEAIRRLIRDHTCEAGVAELNRKLAAVGRHVVSRRPPGGRGPEVITEATVREVLGDGDGDALPPAVRTAIERERRRLSKSSDGDAAASNDWIDWLEQLPWNRRSDAPTDLAQARAALDAGHAGLEQAKTRIVEHLAVRRRNPRGPGAVICFCGPPGVGKTSLAQCVATALGRGFAKLSCGGLRDETDLRGHNRTWKGAQPGSILRELRRIGRKDPVFVLDELDKLGPDPAAVLLEVLDPAQHHRFRDAFVELPFDLSEVLFITTANDPDRIRPALRDRLEVIDLPGYAEAEKLVIARTHLIDAQKRAAGLEAAPLRFTDGACRRIIRDYTSEQGVRQLARCLQAICRKVALGLETGDAALVRDRITAAQVRALLGEPDAAHADGLGRIRRRLDAAALPQPVRARGRRVLAQLSACAPTDPERHRAREYLDRLLSVPWTARAEAPLDLARAHAVLDAGHAGHEAVKQRLLDQLAVRVSNPGAGFPAICVSGPPGVGKSALARLVADALGRPCAWLSCAGLDSAAVHGVRAAAPGRIVEELRRAGVRNPVFVLDEVDRLDEAGGAAAALLDALDPDPAASFRDRYLDFPLELSEALFIATATRPAAVPAMLRERLSVVELPGYTDAEKRVIATRRLLPLQLARHGLTAGQVHVTGEALGALIGGYTREAGVWDLAGALGELCARLARRRAENGGAPVEVTPRTLVELLGAPAAPDVEAAGLRAGRPGVAAGLCCTASGGGALLVVEASCLPGSGALTLTGRQGEVMQESARTALAWLRANAARYGLDPHFHRHTDVHLHVQSAEVPKEGASAGVTMAAALVSAATRRRVRAGVAMSGEITLAGQVLGVGGIAAKVLAAHRGGLARILLPQPNRKQVDEELGDELRRAVEIDYVTRVDELLELALRAPAGLRDLAAPPRAPVSAAERPPGRQA